MPRYNKQTGYFSRLSGDKIIRGAIQAFMTFGFMI